MKGPLAWVVAALVALPACGSDVDLGDLGTGGAGGDDAGGAGGDSGGAGGSGAAGGDGGDGGGFDGPAVHIRFRANTDPFTHDDGLSGQTPLSHVSGLRKFELFESPDGPAVPVFDYGQDFVEVSYADGADTLVDSVPLTSFPAGTYTKARVVHSHVRYEVLATMHANALVLDGQFDNLQVLSDDTLLDGTVRNHGYYEYIFSTAGMEFPASGNDAPIPQWSESGGFAVTFENGEWGYEFPVSIVHTHELAADVTVVLEVNMHESFRWQDQDDLGYEPGVFDSTAIQSEPVLRFGANSFAIYTE